MRAGLLIHAITAQRIVGRTISGDPVYGTKRTISARVQPETQRVRRASDGEEVVSNTRVIAMEALYNDDRIWLPDADTNDGDEAHEVIRASNDTTLDGRLTMWEARL